MDINNCYRLLNNNNCSSDEINACGEWLLNQTADSADPVDQFHIILGLARLVFEKNYILFQCDNLEDSYKETFRLLGDARAKLRTRNITVSDATKAHYKIAQADLMTKISVLRENGRPLSSEQKREAIYLKYSDAKNIEKSTRSSCYKLAKFLQNNPSYFPQDIRDHDNRKQEKQQLISSLFEECNRARVQERESGGSGQSKITLKNLGRTAYLKELKDQEEGDQTQRTTRNRRVDDPAFRGRRRNSDNNAENPRRRVRLLETRQGRYCMYFNG